MPQYTRIWWACGNLSSLCTSWRKPYDDTAKIKL